MKISQLMLVTGVLIISIPGTYFVIHTNSSNVNENGKQSSSELSKEIALLRSEIRDIKNANSKIEEMKQEIVKLKEGKGEQKIQAQIKKIGVEAADASESETEIAAQFNPEETGKKIAEEREKDHERINNTFLAEGSDPTWSSETISLVSGFFESEAGSNVDLSDIQCRKTLCKIEINKPSGSGVNDNFMLNFPMHVSKALGHATLFHEQNKDGSTRITMYLARNGYDLPKDL